MNQLLEKLPAHLKQFIVPQQYHRYTAQNQAVWRYVMRNSAQFLRKNAHASYLDGLAKTGISLDKIPSIEEMNEKLAKIGWAAVTVDGFIPPHAFMEFQAYQVLPIAADIRMLEHIEYTPAPDIIHEAAGHAPIIANPEYAEYLRRFGEIGSKAISSAHDMEIFNAIRHLSILKENAHSKEAEIVEAEEAVLDLQSKTVVLSEMAQIRNLHWWTVEYGLIGSVKEPKIYGAGLLSSISESETCLKKDVLKLPYSIEAAKQNFDITKPQPQLFVTPDFAHLNKVLEEFADNMALRKGGIEGIEKLIASRNIGTIELSTGLQISGLFTRIISQDHRKVVYFQTQGTTALAYRDKELISHGPAYHKEGFGSPLGKLKGTHLAIEDMSPFDLETYGIYEGKKVNLVFESGVTVVGEIITGMRNLQGKIILISLKNCLVTYQEEILFQPEWGIYDMAVGKKIISAYAGFADHLSYKAIYPNLQTVSLEKTINIHSTEDSSSLQNLYLKVRELREIKGQPISQIQELFNQLTTSFPDDWLLTLELLEITPKGQFYNQILQHLHSLEVSENQSKLIQQGLALIENNA